MIIRMVPGIVAVIVTCLRVNGVAVPGDATVSTSCPAVCVHAPVFPRRPDVDVTARLVASAVCEPVSPITVTVDPVARL